MAERRPVGTSSAKRAQGIAFQERWFGTKSEARVRTLVTDMAQRFDAYPEARALLQHARTNAVSAPCPSCATCMRSSRTRSTAASPASFSHRRRDEGRTTVDRAAVARWVESSHPGRWSSVKCTKFASNLLATALDVGLVSFGRREPRANSRTRAWPVRDCRRLRALPPAAGSASDGSLTENPYLRSLGYCLATDSLAGAFRAADPRRSRLADRGGDVEITFQERDVDSELGCSLRLTETAMSFRHPTEIAKAAVSESDVGRTSCARRGRRSAPSATTTSPSFPTPPRTSSRSEAAIHALSGELRDAGWTTGTIRFTRSLLARLRAEGPEFLELDHPPRRRASPARPTVRAASAC